MTPRSLIAVGTLAAASVLVAAAVFAQAPASSPSRLQHVLKVDDTVIVLVADGNQRRGMVRDVTDTVLSLRTSRGTEVLPLERVREVRVRRADPVWNGVVIGLATGALAGLVPDYYDDCAECHDSLYGSIAVGAGIGLLVDAVTRPTPLVYRAPDAGSTMAFRLETNRRRTALVLSIGF